MNISRLFSYILFLFCAFVSAASVSADSVSADSDVAEGGTTENSTELARAATEKLRAGSLDEAIETFEQAIAAGPPSAAVLYNKAIAHARKGESDIARQLFAQAAEDPQVASKARYNMGNTDYAEAVKLLNKPDGQQIAGEDAAAAIGKLQSAISHYRRSLAVDRADADARANIESAYRLIKKIQEQQQQQDPQQQQQDDQPQNQQQDQNQSGQQDQDQQSQDQESDQNPNDTEQSEEESEQQQQQDSGQQQQEEEQQQDQPQQDQAGQDQSQQDQTQDQQDAQDGSEDASNEEQESQQQSKSTEDEGKRNDGDTSDQQEHPAQTQQQPQPEGELKAENETSEGEAPPPEAFQAGQKMTMEEARKMLQAVRDRDFRRRLEKLRQMRSRRIRVERDW